MPDEVDQKIVDALAQSDVQLREIASLAATRYPPGEERDMALLSSGFALGWTTLESNPAPSGVRATPDFKLLVATVARMDDAVESGDASPEVMARLRNPIAEFIQGQVRARKERAVAILVATFGPAAGALIAQDREYTDDEAMDIGFAISAAHRGHFIGFLALLGDSRIKCQCGGHLEQGLSEFGITAEMADTKMRATYGSLYKALAAFGRWYAKDIRNVVGMSDKDAVDSPGILNPGDAQTVAHGFFSRLMLGKTDAP